MSNPDLPLSPARLPQRKGARSRRAAGRILRARPNGEFSSVQLSPRELEAVERARKADTAWFAANPNRSHHLRPALAYEIPLLTPDLAAEAWFVVRQVAPGKRVKTVFMPPDPPLPDREEIGHALFDLIGELYAATGTDRRQLTPEQIRRRAAMLVARGRA